MDAYERKARLYPAATVIFPLTLLGLLLFSLPQWWKGLITFAAAGGLHVPVMLAVRDRGKALEHRLWQSWGGAPTTALLRWAGKTNTVQHQQRHAAIAKATDMALPSRDEEAADPAAADAIYQTAVDVLRERTRGDAYALVQAELGNYGFRRNVYGCRPFGIALAALAFLAEITLAVLALNRHVHVLPALMFAAAATSLVWLAWWTLMVTPAFVKRDADRYALALVLAAAAAKD